MVAHTEGPFRVKPLRGFRVDGFFSARMLLKVGVVAGGLAKIGNATLAIQCESSAPRAFRKQTVH